MKLPLPMSTALALDVSPIERGGAGSIVIALFFVALAVAAITFWIIRRRKQQ